MKSTQILLLLIIVPHFSCTISDSEVSDDAKVYQFSDNLQPRWVSFENLSAEKGRGGMENLGAKGHPYETLHAGETKTILDIKGAGIINRMWVTLRPRSPLSLRGLVVKMYWDDEDKPAVSVPFGDFFGVGLGKTLPFENALFANPEGRSFVSYLQMPFRTAAKIEFINEMDFDISMFFYDVDLQLLSTWDEKNLYLHAFWHRDTVTTLAEDFELLPKVTGKGRFLGTNISINANPLYKGSWWGEGEVKIYLNGDDEFPTLVGTGTEDYIGTGWGQGQFFHTYQGCSIADPDKEQWSYYRYHLVDPIYFKTDCKVTIQQMGGSQKKNVIEFLKNGVSLIPVAIIDGESKQWQIYDKENPVDLESADLPGEDSWVNFYRSDDVAAVSYFYLDKPVNGLPEIQDLAVRTANLRTE